MTFTTVELKAIERRSTGQRDASDAYWNSLTDAQQQATLEWYRKRDKQRETIRILLGGVLVLVWIAFAAIPLVVMVARYGGWWEAP
jgi:hypothetical protein